MKKILSVFLVIINIFVLFMISGNQVFAFDVSNYNKNITEMTGGWQLRPYTKNNKSYYTIVGYNGPAFSSSSMSGGTYDLSIPITNFGVDIEYISPMALYNTTNNANVRLFISPNHIFSEEINSTDPEKIERCAYFYTQGIGYNIMEFHVAPDTGQYYTTVDGVLYSKDMKRLLAYPSRNKRTEFYIPEGVEYINPEAFYNCTYLKYIHLPESLKYISDDCVMFSYYEKFHSLTIHFPKNKCQNNLQFVRKSTSMPERLIDMNYIYPDENLEWLWYSYPYIAHIDNDSNNKDDIYISNYKITGNESMALGVINKDSSLIADVVAKSDKDDLKYCDLNVSSVLGSKSEEYIESLHNKIPQKYNGNINKIFDINLEKNGITVQPESNVDVTFRVSYNTKPQKVYRVEADNTLTDMDASLSKTTGYGGITYYNNPSFTTDHFSEYIIVDVDMELADANNDKSIDILDATVIQKYTTNKISLDNTEKCISDVNNDGTVDILDAMEIQKFVVGKITEFKLK